VRIGMHCKTLKLFRKVISSFVALTFLTSLIVAPVSAQILPVINIPANLSLAYAPPLLLGLKVHPENPLLFDFIVDQGQTKLSTEELKRQTEKLVKYFLAALTIPDKEVWVNLSPYEKDRIIPDVLGQTTMGKTMLEQDYVLKQMAASLTNPETELGKKYWDQVNSVTAVEAKAIKAESSGENRSFSAEAKQSSLLTPSLVKEGQGGVLSSPNASIGDPLSTNPQPLTPNQLNKVWIMPAKAEVLESNGIVLVGQKRLKVMLAEDVEKTLDAGRLTLNQSTLLTPSLVKEGEGGVLTTSDRARNVRGSAEPTVARPLTPNISTNIFRQTILPAIDKAVNESKDFAEVRQIYNSVILAAWYKKALKESLLGKVYTDKGKVAGVETDDKAMKQRIYEQYLAAFKKGAYNLIKEEVDVDGDLIPRKYFSGGAVFEVANIVS
jgi:hypothetical protein